jgi:ribosomal protein L32E
MFKESSERGTGEHAGSEPSTKELRVAMENTSLSFEERIMAADLLIEKYKKLEAITNDVVLKIDRTEAETVRAQLLEDMKRGEINLDFTQPKAVEGLEVQDFSTVEEKIEEEKRKIEAARRGVKLAHSIGDEERVRVLEDRIKEFQQTIELLQPEAQVSQTPPATSTLEEDAFDKAFENTDDGRARIRMDAQAKRKGA